ncbi:MAG: chemotaxis protein CheW [Sphingomonadaceae bacterium]|nr:chemotaxis protein CheW [Sphingomonadaceae bacterium]
MDELLAEFIAETRETLEPLAGEIVAWEAAPDDRERLDSIFRFVHTVKGSCGFLDLPRLEALAHGAESVLAAVRAGERTPDAALVSAVLAIIDRIGRMVEALAAGEDFPDDDDGALVRALEARAAPALAMPDAAAQPPAATLSASRAPARSIRLPVELLDRMMSGVSDIVLARNELARRLREREQDPQLDAAFERLSVCVAAMRDAITRTRMQRIDSLFAALPRLVRDLSVELGRQVTLDIEGGDVELDREMIEMLRDPLTHIVRNALDHGIEPPTERLKAGKAPTGRLRIGARQGGNRILIEIADDGRGIDAERLVDKAIAAGIVTRTQADLMSRTRKLALIFEAGLSTADKITAISGRGVGMDVVRANIERIGGTVDIESQPGHGLRLALSVPLTLTIIPALTIITGGLRFAVPRSAIDEIVTTRRGQVALETAAGATFATIRGRRMPLAELGTLLDLPEPSPGEDRTLIVLRLAGGDRCALAVDQVLDHEELVVKPAAPAVMATGLYAGTTLPDNGQPMLLIDPAGIAAVAGLLDGEAAQQDEDQDETPIEAVAMLLFRGRNGAEYAIRLSLVERIIDVIGEDVRFIGGRLYLIYEDGLVPIIASATIAIEPEARLRVLLISDGATTLGIAVSDVIDVVDVSEPAMPAATPGRIAGVLLIAGRPIELLDAHWLLAEGAQASMPDEDARPLCLLGDATDPWTREVLRPLVEAAGYRTAFNGAVDPARADIVIASEQAPAPADLLAPVIRLRSAPAGAGPADESIYRYDRAALIDALGRVVRKG